MKIIIDLSQDEVDKLGKMFDYSIENEMDAEDFIHELIEKTPI